MSNTSSCETYKTGGASAKHEDMRSQLGADLLQTMASTRSRFKEGGIDPVQVLNLEYLGGRVGAVLGKAAVHGNTMGVELHQTC